MYFGSVIPFIAGPLHMQKYVDVVENNSSVMHTEYQLTIMKGANNYAVYLHTNALNSGVRGWKDLKNYPVIKDVLLNIGFTDDLASVYDRYFIEYSMACLTLPSSFLLDPRMFFQKNFKQDEPLVAREEFNRRFNTYFFKDKKHIIYRAIDSIGESFPEIIVKSSARVKEEYRRVRPLSLSIFSELTEVLKPKNLLELELLGLAISRYVNSTPYLFSVYKKKPRVNLSGQSICYPSEKEIDRAKNILIKRKVLGSTK